jgi:Zn-dependent M28 family amino/carboxypeptidase
MAEADKQNNGDQLSQNQRELADKLEEDVRYLSEHIGERNMRRPTRMEKTVGWIEDRMRQAGYSVTRQTYQIQGGAFQGSSADNIIAELRGEVNPEQIIIIGAHYDTVPASPGANDNSSAVAVLLMLAEWFKDSPQSKTIRFVSFANEEPPFFKTKDMGSYAYARKAQEDGDAIEAMIALDGLGYYSDRDGSQKFPLPGLGLFYPNTANFIAFASRVGDRSLMNKSLNIFRENTELKAEGVALPAITPGVSWSDHWSFWQFDYPAFMITDTLPFRDPGYHSPADTAERLDYRRMALLAEGLKHVVIHLASD